MPARRLEHVNVRTTKLAETVRFYTEVLGLRSGERPSPRPGAWIYDDSNVPVVHISGVDPNDEQSLRELEEHCGSRDLDSLNGSGAIDHVAFEATDYDAFHAHLVGHDQQLKVREVPSFGLRQIFLNDPNGIQIELNFHGPKPGAGAS